MDYFKKREITPSATRGAKRFSGKGPRRMGLLAKPGKSSAVTRFIVAESLEEAAKIAEGNPCLNYGLFYEIRPIDPERASAFLVMTETPQR
jgi:hypothetical protein